MTNVCFLFEARNKGERLISTLRGAFSTSSMQMCYLATSSMLRLNVAPSAETAGPLPLLVNASLLIMYCQSSDKSYCTSSRETVDGESDIWDSRTHRCLTGLPVTYQTLTEHSVYDNRWNIKKILNQTAVLQWWHMVEDRPRRSSQGLSKNTVAFLYVKIRWGTNNLHVYI